MKYIVNFSGGKDSTAMLLRMLEENMQIDEIIFCDTYKEFPQMYRHIEKVDKYIKEKYHKKVTILRANHSFDYYMFEYVKTRGKNKGKKGYSWSGARLRWCTYLMKTSVINKHLDKYKNEEIIQYVGIAYDEQDRIKDKCYPLVKWEMTESDCLQFCYNRGFDWDGLYEFFDRLSCWCCPLKNLEELRVLREYFPKLWSELKEMDKRTYRKFRSDYSVEELERKFMKELEEMIKVLNKNSDKNKIIEKINEIIRHLNYEKKKESMTEKCNKK